MQICEELVTRLEDYGEIGCDEESLKVTVTYRVSIIFTVHVYRVT